MLGFETPYISKAFNFRFNLYFKLLMSIYVLFLYTSEKATFETIYWLLSGATF